MKNISSVALWVLVALVTPVIIIGGLLGALSSAGDGLERVPVALVNNDELIRETDEEGEESIIFASKPLVTELVTSEDFAVDWLVTNSEQARELLATGDVYGIVEIPEDFSRAVTTLDSDDPQQATFTIVTDSSQSYLAGVLADQVGAALAAGISDEFGSGIMEGLFTAIVDISDGFQETADAAETLASGVEELSDGVGELASGYEEFDDGLGEFAAGTRSLSDGLDALSEGTAQLGELSTGISSYTSGVSTLSGGLSTIKSSGALTGNPAEATLNTLIDSLAAAAAGGTTLSSQASTALTGVRDGVVALDKGADALADSSVDLEAGSSDIRDGLSDLAEGTVDLSDGSRQFADGLADGAAELSDNAFGAADDETASVLTSPVAFSSQDRSGDVSLQETFSSVLAPVGMWLVALLYFLVLPSYSSRVLGSSAKTSTLLSRALRPVIGVVVAWTAIVTLMIHTLGSISWSSVVITAPLVALTAVSFAALHFAIWVWNPRWLAPLSLGAFVIQIVSLGNLIPLEILPSFYQAVSGLTPLGWSIEALIAAFAGAEGSRLSAPIAALVVLTAVSIVLSALSLESRRTAGIRSEVMLPASYPTR
ncbi:MAG: ABC transporter permease [Pontimonas sp.]|nr:ABC transporter permease [Pontimonas sp.]